MMGFIFYGQMLFAQDVNAYVQGSLSFRQKVEWIFDTERSILLQEEAQRGRSPLPDNSDIAVSMIDLISGSDFGNRMIPPIRSKERGFWSRFWLGPDEAVAQYFFVGRIEQLLKLRDQWFGIRNLDFDRDVFLGRFVAVFVLNFKDQGKDVSTTLQEFRNMYGCPENDPGVNEHIFKYLEERMSSILREAASDPTASAMKMEGLSLESLYFEAKEKARFQIARQAIQTVIESGPKVIDQIDRGAIVFLGEEILESVAIKVAAELMTGRGISREISLQDADEISQRISLAFATEFHIVDLAIEPGAVRSAIQDNPNLILNWATAKTLVRNICEKGLRRVR